MIRSYSRKCQEESLLSCSTTIWPLTFPVLGQLANIACYLVTSQLNNVPPPPPLSVETDSIYSAVIPGSSAKD